MRRPLLSQCVCGILVALCGPGHSGQSFAQEIPEPEFRLPEWQSTSEGAKNAGGRAVPAVSGKATGRSPVGKPGTYVRDVSGVFSPGDRFGLGRELLAARSEEGIGVYLLTRPELPEGSLLAFMKDVLGEEGREADFAAVILAAGGGDEVPYYFLSGRRGAGLSKPAKQKMLERVEASRLAASGSADRLRGAALALLEELRAEAGPGAEISAGRAHASVGEGMASVPVGARAGAFGLLGSTSFWLAVLGGALAVAAVGMFRVRKARNRPLLFPACEFRHRFSAPFSGGNDAAVHFAAGKRRIHLVE